MGLRRGLGTVAVLMSSFGWAQGEMGDAGVDEVAPADIADVSLEGLLDTRVSLGSAVGDELSQGEAPAIVTVLTRAEIHDLGARDLIDVLRFVPGFDFTSDIENSVGLSVRGISTLEGKALVLLDGMMLDDLAYGNVLFGNRVSVDNIERIEVIRGAGSTVYGGFAELAVINIITHPDKPVDRVAATLLGGAYASGPSRLNASVQGSYSFGDLNVRASAFAGDALRSDQPYALDGVSTDSRVYSGIRPLNVSLGADWKGFSAQFIYDEYQNDAPVWDDLSQPVHKSHQNIFASLKYQRDLNKYVNVAVFARYQHQNPWRATDEWSIVNGYYSDVPIDRILGGVNVTVKPTSWLRFLVGGTVNYDTSTVAANDDPRITALVTYTNAAGETVPTLSFYNVAAFAEAVAFTPVVNITAGARFEDHSLYGVSFVPRIALTKEIGHFHAKALASLAFRPPTFYNISINANIKPETATVFEVEAGYQIFPWLYAGANVFDNRIRNTIVYQTLANGDSAYLNSGTEGTHGVEAEIRLRNASWGYANLAYSYYAAVVNGVDQYNVTGHPELNLGSPAHKFTIRGSLKLGEHFALSPSMIVYSERYGLEQGPTGGDFVLTRFGPTVLLDAFASVRDLPVKGLDISFGVHDLFGSNYKFIPYYNSGQNALPGPGRELQVRFSFLQDFVK